MNRYLVFAKYANIRLGLLKHSGQVHMCSGPYDSYFRMRYITMFWIIFPLLVLWYYEEREGADNTTQ